MKSDLQNRAEAAAERMKKDFRIFQIDTSTGQPQDGPKRTAEVVADLALNVIEEHLREDILSIPKREVADSFQRQRSLPAEAAKLLVEKFNRMGSFAPRDEIEKDKSRTQALPVVVIRNKRGEVLRLRRKERSDENPLHEKVVIWAGGHVRKEDQANGDSMLKCALREVQEELRLTSDPHEPKLRGAVYSELSEKRRSMWPSYEWRAETDDVAVALSSAQFFERRGTSSVAPSFPWRIWLEMWRRARFQNHGPPRSCANCWPRANTAFPGCSSRVGLQCVQGFHHAGQIVPIHKRHLAVNNPLSSIKPCRQMPLPRATAQLRVLPGRSP